MNIPAIIFNSTTDYPDVLEKAKLMFSEIVNDDTCNCKCNDSYNASLCKTLGYLYSADWLESKGDIELIEYKNAVKSAYLSLSCINC